MTAANTTLTTNKGLDFLLLSIPYSDLTCPSLAPALLKSAITQTGHSFRFVDFSLLCLDKLFSGKKSEFAAWADIFVEAFNWSDITPAQQLNLDRALDLFSDVIAQHSPANVGISVFSVWQQRFTYFACQRLKSRFAACQIFVGGSGLLVPPSALRSVVQLNYFQKQNSFAHYLSQKKLVNYAITDDPIGSLISLLHTPNVVGKNNINWPKDTIPDYSDIDLDAYFYETQKELLIEGSKGCVRQCVFCDDHKLHSYQFRAGEQIAAEMIELSKKHDVYKFWMVDSLVNGSLPQFRSFLKTVAKHNDSVERKIIWHGNYICRASNSLSDEDYRLLKLSGAHALTIGAESGSNKVLDDMQKKMQVQDLEYEIRKFSQFGLSCHLLFLIGFYTETWDDFVDTLKLLKRLRPFFYDGTVVDISLGYTLQIRPNNEPWSKVLNNNFKVDPVDSFNWIYRPNSTLTRRERIRRRVIAQEWCDRLGIPVKHAKQHLEISYHILHGSNAVAFGLNHE